MKAVERDARAVLRTLPVGIRDSTLTEAALNLARRLDSEPPDREATMLARELRQTTAALHCRAPKDSVDDVEAFLARVAAPDLGDTTN